MLRLKTEKAKQKAIRLILKFEELKLQECMFRENKGTLIIHHQPTGRNITVIHTVKNSNSTSKLNLESGLNA